MPLLLFRRNTRWSSFPGIRVLRILETKSMATPTHETLTYLLTLPLTYVNACLVWWLLASYLGCLWIIKLEIQKVLEANSFGGCSVC